MNGKTNCKRCGKAIEFVRMRSGRLNPVDIEPRVTVVTDAGDAVTGRTSHFATCPHADDFRKKRPFGGSFSAPIRIRGANSPTANFDKGSAAAVAIMDEMKKEVTT